METMFEVIAKDTKTGIWNGSGLWCRSDWCNCERSNSARKERRMKHEH